MSIKNSKNVKFGKLRILVFIVFTLGLVAKSSANDHRPDAAGPILQAFQSSCDSVGSWSAGAIANTDGITSIVTQLLLNDACKPYKTQLDGIQSLISEVSRNFSSSTAQAYQAQDHLVNLLSLQIQTTTDPTALAYLQSSLAAAVQARAQALVSSGNEHWDHAWAQSANAVGFLNNLTAPNASPTLGQCLRQSPAAAIQLGNNLLSYGSGFFSPVVGASVSVIGQLVNTAVEQLRQARYDRAIWNLQRDRMPVALRCALESMTEYYCKAEDSFSLIELAKENDEGSDSAPIFKGLDLATRYLPSLISWLNKVEQGVVSEDSFQAEKRNAIDAKRNSLNQLLRTIDGTINEALKSYREFPGTDETIRQSILLESISQIVNLLQQSNSSYVNGVSTQIKSPTLAFQGNSYYWACWLVSGYKDVSLCKTPPTTANQTAGGDGLQTYIRTEYLKKKEDFDRFALNFIGNWHDSVSKVQELVNSDYGRIIITNADTILGNGGESGLNGANSPAPHDTLALAVDFLTELKSQPLTQRNLGLVSEIENRLFEIENALKVLEGQPSDMVIIERYQSLSLANSQEVKICDEKRDCSTQRMEKIAKIFKLKDGTQGLASSLADLVEIDLIHRIKMGQFPSEKPEILKALGLNITLTLSSSGLSDKNPLNTDLNTAQAITGTNLKNFKDFFVKAFSDAVKNEAKNTEGEPTQSSHRPHGEMLGALCTQWLITSRIPQAKSEVHKDWPSEEVAAICRSAKIYSANRKKITGEDHPAISVSELETRLKNVPFSGERVCAYHRYRRKDFLSTLPAFHKGEKKPSEKTEKTIQELE